MRYEQRQQLSQTSALRDLLSLGLLTGGAIGLGAALWWLTGPPGIPSIDLDWARIVRILSASEIPPQIVVGFAAGIAWLVLGYLALTLLLRLAATILLAMTNASAWAEQTLRLSNLITLPLVRRAVDGAVAAVLLTAVWTRTETVTHVEAAAVAADVSVQRYGHGEEVECEEPATQVGQDIPAQCFASYTVRPGDSFWGIARRFYGDGSLYPLVFGANEGRTMVTGEILASPRLIRAGWTLQIPLPAAHLWVDEGQALYRVRPGDSLWGIGAGLLGDGSRWLEIWNLNRGRDMGDGRRLTEPGAIHPGWVLALPADVRTEDLEGGPIPNHPTAPEVAGVWGGTDTSTPESQAAPDLPPGTRAEQGPWSWSTPDIDWTSLLPAAAIGVGVAGAGVGALAARRALKARGFTFALPRNRKAFRSDAGRVLLAAQALVSALKDLEFGNVELVLVQEGERDLRFTFDCAPGDADALSGRRYDLGRRLACIVNGEVLTPTRVVLLLSGFRRLVGMMAAPEDRGKRSLLIPVGARDGAVHYLNLTAAGGVALVGHGAEPWQTAAGWLAALTSGYGPDELALVPDEGASSRLGDLGELPHFASKDSGGRSLDQTLFDLEEALVARGSSQPERPLPAVVAVVELPSPVDPEIGSRLEMLRRRGPELGIHIIAVAEEMADDDATAFGAIVDVAPAHDEDWETEASQARPRAEGIILRLGSEPPLDLEPVVIRNQPPRIALDDFHSDVVEAREGGTNGSAGFATEELDDFEAEDVPGDNAEDPDPKEELGEAARPSGGPATADGRTSAGPSPVAVKESVGRQTALLLAEEEQSGEVTAVAASGPLFEVRCFGGFRIEAQGQEITSWRIQKPRELLAYLLARGGSGVLKDEIEENLWPEGNPDHATHQLHNAGYYLRRTLRTAAGQNIAHVFRVSAERYHLNLALFQVDLDTFESHLRRTEGLEGTEALVEYEKAIITYQGPFLGSEPYEWADPYRREYERRFLAAVHKAAQLALECRDIHKALDLYHRILANNPIDEEAARGLMTCYAKLGDLNGVRKVYKVLTEALRRDLDDEKAEPLPETTAFFLSLAAKA